MPLPSHLDQYEFQRKLQPSADVERFYHLRVEREPDGTPIRTQSGEAEYNPLGLEAVLGRPGPIEVEIGCGKGTFMVEYCAKHPHRPFIGIDSEPSIAYLAAKRLAKRPELKFARVFCGDAFYLFRDFLPENSVDVFHIYFPDPWPKKRHHKRRLLRPEFLNQLQRVSAPEARLMWATDFLSYHEKTLELAASLPWITLEDPNAPPTEGILTNFEKKYVKEGRPIYRCVFRIP